MAGKLFASWKWRCHFQEAMFFLMITRRYKHSAPPERASLFRIRTGGPLLRRQMLYQLSYRAHGLLNLTEEKWSGRRGSNPQHPAWESKLSTLYFQHLQNRSGKINVHALHTVHAMPNLRIAAGRLRDGFYRASSPGLRFILLGRVW